MLINPIKENVPGAHVCTYVIEPLWRHLTEQSNFSIQALKHKQTSTLINCSRVGFVSQNTLLIPYSP